MTHRVTYIRDLIYNKGLQETLCETIPNLNMSMIESAKESGTLHSILNIINEYVEDNPKLFVAKKALFDITYTPQTIVIPKRIANDPLLIVPNDPELSANNLFTAVYEYINDKYHLLNMFSIDFINLNNDDAM